MTQPTRSPGVLVERRAVLQLPAVGAAVALTPKVSTSDEGPLAFGAFVRQAAELASEHLGAGRIDPDVYLHRLAAAGARLDGDSLPTTSTGAFGGYDPPVEFGVVQRVKPLFVILWRLAPGAILPPHNHTPAYVHSLCLEGQCWVRHFEIVGDAPAPGAEGAFQMRKTQARLLRPGLGTTLTPERDNVHTFQAGPEGAVGIDINTSVPGEGDWSMIAYEEGKREGFTKLYEARWTGKPG